MTLVPVSVSRKAAEATSDFFQRFGGISGFIESVLSVPKGFLEHWNQTNLIRWYQAFEAERAKREAEGRKPIPPSLLMPALRQIALEDDEDKLVIWARLFANFEDPDKRLEPDKLFVDVLSEMQPLDVALLHYIAVRLPDRERVPGEAKDNPIDIHHIAANLSLEAPNRPASDVTLALYNLHRLGCMLGSPGSMIWSNDFANIPLVLADHGIFRLTSLGARLVDACRE